MIVCAAIRVAGGMILEKTIDIIWGDFFGYLEASIGIMVVSVTAFRSLLGVKASERRQKRVIPYSYRKRFMPWKASGTTESDMEPSSLPAIPSATLTGMRTFINGRGALQSRLEEEEEAAAAAARTSIKVTHHLSVRSEHSVCSIIRSFNGIHDLLTLRLNT